MVLAKLVCDEPTGDIDTWEQRDILIQDSLQDQVSPVPNKSLLKSKGTVGQLRGKLKACASMEELPRSTEHIRGCISAWTSLVQSLNVSMSEVTKAVRDVTKKRKRKEKEDEAKKKKAEAKASAAASAKAKMAAKAPTGAHIFAEVFEHLSTAEKITVEGGVAAGDSFFNDQCASVTRCVVVGAGDPVAIVNEKFFNARIAIFLEQFASSSAALNTGRAFMKVGVVGPTLTKLSTYYAKMASTSKPHQLSDENQQALSTPGLVGVVAGRTSFHIVDLASFRHGFGSGKLDIIVMRLGEFMEMCQDTDARYAVVLREFLRLLLLAVCMFVYV